ncbi:UNVERIFIED_ORG: hypothetical protein GGD47_004867 [Rhizobium etli]
MLVDLDLAAVRRKPAHEDAAADAIVRIGRARPPGGDFARTDRHIKRPVTKRPGRRHQRLRLAQDRPALPFGIADETRAAEAAGAGAARLGREGACPGRQCAGERLAIGCRRLLLARRQHLAFFPEFLAFGIRQHQRLAQPFVVALEDDGQRIFKASAITAEDQLADHPNRGTLAVARQDGACRKANEIQRIGHHRRIVEIIDAPDEPALAIAPGAEILQMRIANRQHCGRAAELRADIEDDLAPAPIGGAQEDEIVAAHLLALFLKIVLDEIGPELAGEPGLEIPNRLRYRRHGAGAPSFRDRMPENTR